MNHHTIATGPSLTERPAGSDRDAASATNRLQPGALDAAILEADRMALALRAALERITIPLARAAQAFVRNKAWFPFGHARVADHARERFGRSGRWVCDLAALGRAMETLPALREALTGDDGERPIGMVAALRIGRVATPASLPAWVALARSLPVRELRDAVRRARTARSSHPLASDVVAAVGTPSVADAGGDVMNTSSAGDAISNADGTRAQADTLAGTDGTPRTGVAPPAEEYHAVRFFLPRAVRVAFDETLDLYRAVVGSEATLSSFVEALVAESSTAGHPLEDAPTPIHPRADPAARERALAVETDQWKSLPQAAGSRREVLMARATLALLDELSGQAGRGKPEDLDAQLRRLIALHAEMERRLGALLAAMSQQRAWRELRFAGIGHYGEQRLGLSRTSTEDAARLARALRRFPHLNDAHREGRVGNESARLVTQALGLHPVQEDVEKAWVRRAECVTVKRLRDELRLLGRRAVTPEDTRRPGTRPRRPWPPTDAEWHASLRRDPGLARQRVSRLGVAALEQFHPNVLLRNEPCRRAMRGSWERTPFPGLMTGRSPDMETVLRLRLPATLAGDLVSCAQSYRGALRRTAEQVPPDDEAWSDEKLPASVRAALLCRRRHRPVPRWVGLLAMLEEFVHVWDDPQAMPRRHSRQVYARDGWRCTAPGCTSRKNLEDHHVHYRSRGGSDETANRTCLCRFHHQRGEHGDLASCRGKAPLGLLWRLGKPGLATWFRSERRLAAGSASR